MCVRSALYPLGFCKGFLAIIILIKFVIMLGLVVDPEIKAIARLEFEDGLRTGVLRGGCWYPCGSYT